jgi:hypothetical protein
MQRAAFGRWNWGAFWGGCLAWGGVGGVVKAGWRLAVVLEVRCWQGRRDGVDFGREVKRSCDDAAARREHHREKQPKDRQQQKQRTTPQHKGRGRRVFRLSYSRQDTSASAIRFDSTSASETDSAAITASRPPHQPVHPSFVRPRHTFYNLPLSSYRHVL